MTLRYRLFGIPGNEDEFLDRERRRGNEEVQIYVQSYFKRHIIPPYLITAINKLFIISEDGRNQFGVTLDRSYFPPEDQSVTAIPMRDDRSPLVKRLKHKGFKISNRTAGSMSPQKSPHLNRG